MSTSIADWLKTNDLEAYLPIFVENEVDLKTLEVLTDSDLKELGLTPHSTELDEFIKAGGSAKCLTLRLDGEDAARWP